MKKWLLVAMVCTLAFAFMGCIRPANGGQVVIEIEDPVLEASIRNLIGKPEGEILLADVLLVTEIDVRGQGITSIEGLQHFANLEYLDISRNLIASKNLAQISELLGLTYLNIRECEIDDISAIANLVNLEYLNIHTNEDITDLTPIVGLINLEELIMRNVWVPAGQMNVFEGLVNLYRLNIRNANVDDVQVLADLMGQGALQDVVEGDVVVQEATLDIRQNPIVATIEESPIWPFLGNISNLDY